MNIFDIINNARDELSRSYELLKDNEEAESSMLLQDIEYSLERLDGINDKISFALIIAVYTAYLNAQNNYESDCDNCNWTNAYIEEASKIDLQYDGRYVNSEWAYNAADEIAKKIYKE